MKRKMMKRKAMKRKVMKRKMILIITQAFEGLESKQVLQLFLFDHHSPVYQTKTKKHAIRHLAILDAIKAADSDRLSKLVDVVKNNKSPTRCQKLKQICHKIIDNMPAKVFIGSKNMPEERCFGIKCKKTARKQFFDILHIGIEYFMHQFLVLSKVVILLWLV